MMSAANQTASVSMVDTSAALVALIDEIDDISDSETQPLLFIDLEGINLSRHGTISIVTIFNAHSNAVYLVDVFTLGHTAFNTANMNLTSLKGILESRTLTKVIFDVRNDSDALFSLYNISIAGIEDLQLMELATRYKRPKQFVAGLAKCIEYDSGISAPAKGEWQLTKRTVTQLFDPKEGGRYEVFNERPLKPELAKYCAQDVVLLPKLYDVYHTKLHSPGNWRWIQQVMIATEQRIESSHSPDYEPHAQSKKFGPWNNGILERGVGNVAPVAMR